MEEEKRIEIVISFLDFQISLDLSEGDMCELNIHLRCLSLSISKLIAFWLKNKTKQRWHLEITLKRGRYTGVGDIDIPSGVTDLEKKLSNLLKVMVSASEEYSRLF